MNEHKALALKALDNMRGDDLYRAQQAFAGLSEAEMNKEYGRSGRTRKEVLAEHEAHEKKVDAAIEWLKALP